MATNTPGSPPTRDAVMKRAFNRLRQAGATPGELDVLLEAMEGGPVEGSAPALQPNAPGSRLTRGLGATWDWITTHRLLAGLILAGLGTVGTFTMFETPRQFVENFFFGPSEFAPKELETPPAINLPGYRMHSEEHVEKKKFKWPVSFQPPRYEVLHILARGERKLDINGILDDDEWDSSGQFTSSWQEPYRQARSITGIMMADANHLYIAADVRDPSPMRFNKYFKDKPSQTLKDEGGWDSTSIQIRLAPSEDADKGAKTLTIWCERKAGDVADSLNADFHMVDHDDKTMTKIVDKTTAGLRAVFTKKPGGYQMEAQVPWTLFFERPTADKDMRLCWNVFWTDERGLWIGKLVEFVDPKEFAYSAPDAEFGPHTQDLTDSSPKMWGRAKLHLK